MVSCARQFTLILFARLTSAQTSQLRIFHTYFLFIFFRWPFFTRQFFVSWRTGSSQPNSPLYQRSSYIFFTNFFRVAKVRTYFSLLSLLGRFLSLCFFPSSSGSTFHFRLFFFFLFSRRRALQPNLLISQCVRSRPGSNLRDERQQPRFWPKEADKREWVWWRIVRYWTRAECVLRYSRQFRLQQATTHSSVRPST